MSAQPGPSQAPGQPQPPPLAGNPDLKRRAEADTEAAARRMKHPRPPLPPPHILQALVPDSPAFADLLKLESKLDWTLLRKKAEINDALGRSTRVRRTLRVYLSHTCHDQPWQSGNGEAGDDNKEGDENKEDVTMSNAGAPPGMDVNTGKGIPGWILRIEGRLLDTGNHRLDKNKRKFTSFLRSAVVEFDNREAPTFPEGNIVEWHASPSTAPLDGFEILRRGDQNVKARIVLHVQHTPERFKVTPPLAELISVREGTRAEVMAAVWQLVKAAGAQDKEDPSIIRPVGGLEKLFPHGVDGVAFHQIPEVITRCLAHPDPVVIPYEIDVSKDHAVGSKCYDIPVEVEDPLKSKMATIIAGFEGQAGSDIVKLEDKVGELAYFARDLKQKREFLDSFAASPYAFIHNWLAAQARDLDAMLGYQIGMPGTNGGSVREEDIRRSDLFQLPWVDEAIVAYESGRR